MKMSINTLSVNPMKINDYVEYHELCIKQKNLLSDIDIKFTFHQRNICYPKFIVNINCKIKRKFLKTQLSCDDKDILVPSINYPLLFSNINHSSIVLYDINLYQIVLKWLSVINYRIILDKRKFINSIRLKDEDLNKISDACFYIASHMDKDNI